VESCRARLQQLVIFELDWEAGNSLPFILHYFIFGDRIGFESIWNNYPKMSAASPISRTQLYSQGSRKDKRSVKEIPLTNSDQKAKVDDEDYGLVMKHKWFLNRDGYAQTYINGKPVLMQNFIMAIMQLQKIRHI
jgi:hypothetical protein